MDEKLRRAIDAGLRSQQILVGIVQQLIVGTRPSAANLREAMELLTEAQRLLWPVKAN